MKINTLIKSLGTLAASAVLLAGTAFAGSTGTQNLSTTPNQSGVLTESSAVSCPMMTPKYVATPVPGKPGYGFAFTSNGYRSTGCQGVTIATMTCKGAKTACATMAQ